MNRANFLSRNLKEKTTTSPALLLGIDRLVGLQTARILWRHGITVIGTAFDPHKHYCHTRAVKRIDSIELMEKDPELYLQQIIQEFGSRPVIIPCIDECVWWLHDHREIVNNYSKYRIPSRETLELLADKEKFYKYAAEKNLPIPPTYFVRDQTELEEVAKKLNYPVILKPPRKSVKWMRASGDNKVLKVDDANELMRIGPSLMDAVDELILQQWVRGPDAGMHSLYFCLDEYSQPYAMLIAKKIRQWPPDTGVGSLAMEVCEDELLNTGLDIVQKLGYTGPGSVQFKKDEITDKFYIIEVNARPTLNFPLFEACGCEATYALYCNAGSLDMPEELKILRPGAKWICWKTDLASGFVHWKRGDITLWDWIGSIRGHKWSADIQLDDPMPILIEIYQKITRGISKKSIKTLTSKS